LLVAYLAADVIGGAVTPEATEILAGAVAVDVLMLVFVVVMQSGGGRNWARVVLAVLSGLRLSAALFVLILFRAGISGARVGFAVLLLILLAAAVVTMSMPAANAWFALGGHTRQQSRSGLHNAVNAPEDKNVHATQLCSNCGKQIQASSSFCIHCGKRRATLSPHE
jgi:hypothetical protein